MWGTKCTGILNTFIKSKEVKSSIIVKIVPHKQFCVAENAEKRSSNWFKRHKTYPFLLDRSQKILLEEDIVGFLKDSALHFEIFYLPEAVFKTSFKGRMLFSIFVNIINFYLLSKHNMADRST